MAERSRRLPVEQDDAGSNPVGQPNMTTCAVCRADVPESTPYRTSADAPAHWWCVHCESIVQRPGPRSPKPQTQVRVLLDSPALFDN